MNTKTLNIINPLKDIDKIGPATPAELADEASRVLSTVRHFVGRLMFDAFEDDIVFGDMHDDIWDTFFSMVGNKDSGDYCCKESFYDEFRDDMRYYLSMWTIDPDGPGYIPQMFSALARRLKESLYVETPYFEDALHNVLARYFIEDVFTICSWIQWDMWQDLDDEEEK